MNNKSPNFFKANAVFGFLSITLDDKIYKNEVF